MCAARMSYLNVLAAKGLEWLDLQIVGHLEELVDVALAEQLLLQDVRVVEVVINKVQAQGHRHGLDDVLQFHLGLPALVKQGEHRLEIPEEIIEN